MRACRTDRTIAVVVAVVLVPVVALLTGTAQAMAPTPVLAPFVNYEVGAAHGVAIGDFTGDGRQDAVVSTEGDPDALHLFVQGPNGWFAEVQALPTALDYSPQAGLAAGDLDGDGHTDAALASGHSVEIFYQRAGALTPAVAIPVPGAQQVLVSDLDADGRADLVVSTFRIGTVHLEGEVVVLRGLGGGTFAAPVHVATDIQTEIQVGDVTGDGYSDIVTCAGFEVRVYAQTGAGDFAEPAVYDPAMRCVGVAVGDFNGDGRLDAAVAGSGAGTAPRASVLPQRPDGTFGPTVSYRTVDGPGALSAGDVNGDGRTDLLVLSELRAVLGIYAQAPDHSFDEERVYPLPPNSQYVPKQLAVGDVNGDGRNDILRADGVHGLVVLWHQAAGPSTTTSTVRLPTTTIPPDAPPGIFAPVQVYDVSSRPEYTNPDSLVTGDFNGDGRPDVAMTTNSHHDPDNDWKLFVFLQGADGSFERSIRYDTNGQGSDVMVLGAGDLDGDGRLDLVLRMRDGIDVFLQRDGGFADRKFHEMPFAYRVDVADLDGDGIAELIMSGSGITVLRSLGGTAFGPPETVSTEHSYKNTAVGDVTGDGRPDIVSTGRALRVFRQLPDGSFADAVLYQVPDHSEGAVTIGDMTGDGRLDVVTTSWWFMAMDSSEIHVFAQTAAGTMAAPVVYPSWQSEAVRVADVDGDGGNDVVTVHGGGGIGYLLHRADGTLAPEAMVDMPYTTFHEPDAIAATDLTGDGRPDVALASGNHGLAFLRNTARQTPVTPAARYVDRLTRELLGRPPTGVEAAAWVPIAGTAGGRTNLSVALVGTLEYRSRWVGEQAQARLGHAPDPGQALALVNAMATGAIVEIAPALFLGSDEFFAGSGATAEGFVDALFLDVFGVKPDGASRAALAGVVRSGYSRIALAVLVLVHPAARGRVVDVAYQRYVGHAPDPAMRSWWVDAIGRGVRSEYLVAYLVSTEEYLNLG